MADKRHANTRWTLAPASDNTLTWDQVKVAVLMDIRDELQRLNGLLHCSNFTGIPTTLRSIRRAMPTRRKRG